VKPLILRNVDAERQASSGDGSETPKPNEQLRKDLTMDLLSVLPLSGVDPASLSSNRSSARPPAGPRTAASAIAGSGSVTACMEHSIPEKLKANSIRSLTKHILSWRELGDVATCARAPPNRRTTSTATEHQNGTGIREVSGASKSESAVASSSGIEMAMGTHAQSTYTTGACDNGMEHILPAVIDATHMVELDATRSRTHLLVLPKAEPSSLDVAGLALSPAEADNGLMQLMPHLAKPVLNEQTDSGHIKDAEGAGLAAEVSRSAANALNVHVARDATAIQESDLLTFRPSADLHA